MWITLYSTVFTQNGQFIVCAPSRIFFFPSKLGKNKIKRRLSPAFSGDVFRYHVHHRRKMHLSSISCLVCSPPGVPPRLPVLPPAAAAAASSSIYKFCSSGPDSKNMSNYVLSSIFDWEAQKWFHLQLYKFGDNVNRWQSVWWWNYSEPACNH